MFIKKSDLEVINFEKEIKIVGLSLANSGWPKQSGKIGDLWGVFIDKYQKEIKNLIIHAGETMAYGYGFWFDIPETGDYDYLVGNAVNDFEDVDDDLTAYSIPAGEYIKWIFNSEDWDELNDLIRNQEIIKKYAEENGLKILDMPPFPVTKIEVNLPEEKYPSAYILQAVE